MLKSPASLLRTFAVLFTSLFAVACVGGRVVYPVMPTAAELAQFQAAGPEVVPVVVDELMALNVGQGAYRLVREDLLEVELPVEVAGQTLEGGGDPRDTFRSRVDAEGLIRLPLIGALEVKGRTLGEVEELVASAYFPKHLNERPNVVATVAEHHTVSVAVMGAVMNPGIHDLRSDRRSLLGAMMEAGGINPDRGASAVRILRAGEGPGSTKLLSVRNSTIPFADVALVGGETLVFEPLGSREFTVIGLVNRSGAYPYPVDQTYNLMQALAVAGGVSETAAPRYATVYRKDAAGEIIAATFKIDGTSLLDASNIRIKPDDVIAVDHTQGSWTRQLLSQILGFRWSYNTSNTNQY